MRAYLVRRSFRKHRRHWLLLTAGTVVAGAIGWVIDVSLLWVLVIRLGVPTAIAAVCGMLASASVNFVANRAIHQAMAGQGVQQASRYLLLFAVNLAVVAISVPVLAEALDRLIGDRSLGLIGAKVVMTAALLLANSVAYRRWVFAASQGGAAVRETAPDDPGAERAGTLVVIPAFNERESLPGVFDELRNHLPDIDVLVVDDGSTDGTAALARAAGVQAISMPFNVGVGGATRAGLLFARRHGYAAVVQVDADGQHPPASVASLLVGLGEADLVIGARFAGQGTYDAHGPRRWAMRLLAAAFSRIHGSTLTDVTSGFRAFGPRAIDVLSVRMPPEYLGDTIDALVIARQHALVVRQIPVSMRERQGGIPSHGPLKATVFLLRALLMLGLSLIELGRVRDPRDLR